VHTARLEIARGRVAGRGEDGSLSCGESSCESGTEYAAGCRCDGGQPKNFLRPCVLLLLAEQSAHGYDLLDRLKVFGFSRDPGGLYRVLRSLERESLVVSRWAASVLGPDRCLYTLTPLGREWLTAWADTLDDTRRTLETYLYRYSRVVAAEAGQTAPEPPAASSSRRITLDDAPAFKAIVQSTGAQTSAEELTW
jgi:PadR family transcriptional regulator PadR